MAEPTPDTRRRARILARNAIARVERMVRTREPIEWIKGPGDLPLRRTQGGKEAAALRVLLDLARDGQKWRALQANVTAEQAWMREEIASGGRMDDFSAEPATTESVPASTSVTPSEEGGADVHDALDA